MAPGPTAMKPGSPIFTTRAAKCRSRPPSGVSTRKPPNATLEVFARGLRNTYHFTWDHAGRLLGVENGPDADAPEELNVLTAGGHYGFPFQFSDWSRKPYPHTPDAPTGLTITRPIRNLGPDALGA